MNKAEYTRHSILEKAFQLIYRNGFQATSIDKIIETTAVTKGAFYYHFKNKDEMGLAMINEIIYPRIKKGLIDPLKKDAPPIDLLYQTIEDFMLGISEEQLIHGCPTNNLIQEMAPLNDQFRMALSRIIELWKAQIIILLNQALDKGLIQAHNFDGSAQFIIASYEGARGLGKVYKSFIYYHIYLQQLKYYLNGL